MRLKHIFKKLKTAIFIAVISCIYNNAEAQNCGVHIVRYESYDYQWRSECTITLDMKDYPNGFTIRYNDIDRDLGDIDGLPIKKNPNYAISNGQNYYIPTGSGTVTIVYDAARDAWVKKTNDLRIIDRTNSGNNRFTKVGDKHYRFNIADYYRGFTITDLNGNVVEDVKVLNDYMFKYNCPSCSYSCPGDKCGQYHQQNNNSINYFLVAQNGGQGGVADLRWNGTEWELSLVHTGIKVRDVQDSRDIPVVQVANGIYRIDLRDTKQTWSRGFTLFDDNDNLIILDEDTPTEQALLAQGKPIVKSNLKNGRKCTPNFAYRQQAFDLSYTKNYWSTFNVLAEHFLFFRWNGSVWQMELENEMVAGYDAAGNPEFANLQLTAKRSLGSRVEVSEPEVSCTVPIILVSDSTMVCEDATSGYNLNHVNQYHWYMSEDNVNWTHIYSKSRWLHAGANYNLSHGMEDGDKYYRVEYTDLCGKRYVSNSIYLYKDRPYIHNSRWGVPPKTPEPMLELDDSEKALCPNNCYIYKVDLADPKWIDGFAVVNHTDEFIQNVVIDCNLDKYIYKDGSWYATYKENIPAELFMYVYKEDNRWYFSRSNPCSKIEVDIDNDGVSCGSASVITATPGYSDYKWYISSDNKNWMVMSEFNNMQTITVGGDEATWSRYGDKYIKVSVENGASTSTTLFVPDNHPSIKYVSESLDKYKKLEKVCCDVYRFDINDYTDEEFMFNPGTHCDIITPSIEDERYFNRPDNNNPYYKTNSKVCEPETYAYLHKVNGEWSLSLDNNLCGCIALNDCGHLGVTLERGCVKVDGKNNSTQKLQLHRPKVTLCDDIKGDKFYLTYDVEQMTNSHLAAGTEVVNGDTVHYMWSFANGNLNGDIKLKWTVKVFKKTCNGDILWGMLEDVCDLKYVAPLDTVTPNGLLYNICASSNVVFNAVQYGGCAGNITNANPNTHSDINCEWFVQYVTDGMTIGDMTANEINTVGSGIKTVKDYETSLRRVSINFNENNIYNSNPALDRQGVYVVGFYQYIINNGQKEYLYDHKPVYTFINVVAEPDTKITLVDASNNPIAKPQHVCKSTSENLIKFRAYDSRSHCIRNYAAAAARGDIPAVVMNVINKQPDDLSYELRYTVADNIFGANSLFRLEYDNPAPSSNLYVPSSNGNTNKTNIENGKYMTKEDVSCSTGSQGVYFSIINNNPLCDISSINDLSIDSIVAKFMFYGGVSANNGCTSNAKFTNEVVFDDNDFVLDCDANDIQTTYILTGAETSKTIPAYNPMSMSGACNDNPYVSVTLNNGGSASNIDNYEDLENATGTLSLLLGKTTVTYTIYDDCNNTKYCTKDFVLIQQAGLVRLIQ